MLTASYGSSSLGELLKAGSPIYGVSFLQLNRSEIDSGGRSPSVPEPFGCFQNSGIDFPPESDSRG